MGRLVTPIRRGAELMSGAPNDDYPTRVAKYIPSEVIAGYLAVQNILPNSAGDCRVPSEWWYLLYAFFVAITPIYLYNRRIKGDPYMVQLAISTAAFVIWSYALTSCAKFGIFPKDFYNAGAAAVLLIVFSLGVGAFQPAKTVTGTTR